MSETLERTRKVLAERALASGFKSQVEVCPDEDGCLRLELSIGEGEGESKFAISVPVGKLAVDGPYRAADAMCDYFSQVIAELLQGDYEESEGG